MIYILYSCLCQLVDIRELIFVLLFVINRSFVLFIVRYLFCFHFHRFLVYLLFKRERAILILNCVQVFRSHWQLPVQVPIVQHHHLESMNIIQQTPLTLSSYRKRRTYYHYRHSGIDETNILHIDNHSSGRDSKLLFFYLYSDLIPSWKVLVLTSRF